MAAQPRAGVSVEDYLAFERASAEKHEYRAGAIVAMVGASYAHNTIVGNAFASLRTRLRDGSCRVNFSDLRVQIPGERFYTYPDLTVICGQPRFSDNRQDTLLNPQLIVEVLSPSTEAYDRGTKFQYYREIESLREYLLIAQDKARIELFSRQTGGLWTLSEAIGHGSTLRLAALDCVLPLSEVYEEVLPPEEADSDD